MLHINTFFLLSIVFLIHLSRRNTRRSIKTEAKGDEKGSKKSKPQSLKYTAARLHEKGVILEIKGLQVNQ